MRRRRRTTTRTTTTSCECVVDLDEFGWPPFFFFFWLFGFLAFFFLLCFGLCARCTFGGYYHISFFGKCPQKGKGARALLLLPLFFLSCWSQATKSSRRIVLFFLCVELAKITTRKGKRLIPNNNGPFRRNQKQTLESKKHSKRACTRRRVGNREHTHTHSQQNKTKATLGLPSPKHLLPLQ